MEVCKGKNADLYPECEVEPEDPCEAADAGSNPDCLDPVDPDPVGPDPVDPEPVDPDPIDPEPV